MSRTHVRKLSIDKLEDRRLLAVVAGDVGVDDASQPDEVLVGETGHLGHNEGMPLDVNADLDVSAVDLLMIVNHLNNPEASNGFLDTSGDNSVSPVDGLLIINHLNDNSGFAEGEKGSNKHASSSNYDATGTVQFSNLQELLAEVTTQDPADPQFSAIVPLKAKQFSEFNGQALQTGSITANSLARPANQDDLDSLQESLETVGQSIDFESFDVILTFTGVQGPNQQYGNRPLQVITGRGGQVHTTWVAQFYVFIDLEAGEAVLSGDGDFSVVGGTGQNSNATGEFLTIFITDRVSLSADGSEADYWQVGSINR